jgi:hypothetical protein
MYVSSEVWRERLSNGWHLFLIVANCILFVLVITTYFTEDAAFSIVYKIADVFLAIQSLLLFLRYWNWRLEDIEYTNCLLQLLYFCSLILLTVATLF